jgi:hypothetical protein
MKRIILLLLVSSIVYATFFTEKDRLDREVKRLCAIDGGITVYETVKLPAERFDGYGQIAYRLNGWLNLETSITTSHPCTT